MKDSKVKDAPKPKQDINPFSKANEAFRKRHDISVSDFKRFVNGYQVQFG